MSLQALRKEYIPNIPCEISDINITVQESSLVKVDKKIENIFEKTSKSPLLSFISGKGKKANFLKVGVLFSGGPAPGGHNVIAGVFDSLKKIDNRSQLYGFLNGPDGILKNKYIVITKELIDNYRNCGGFDLIGSSRTKIETEEQFKQALNNVKSLDLDGLIIIGGDDSNTNALYLAEFFLKENFKTKVVGVPKTIDGDLKNEYILISFGFDTACKVYSEMIGNLARDAMSSKKYYHFIKLMGRSASHIALECALKTQPNFVLIGEEIFKGKKGLDQIVKDIAEMVIKRAKQNKNYGIILIPEGIIEFIYEIKMLIGELNKILSSYEKKFKSFEDKEKIDFVLSKLSNSSKKSFLYLPKDIQKQLLLKRDPHGNVQVSQIETEKLLIDKVKEELKNKKDIKFNPIAHFFGYEGRASFPSNFDANYCYALGFVASSILKEGYTGYICAISNLNKSVNEWRGKAIPLASMMNMEIRKGKEKAVIKKALVDLKGKPFEMFVSLRDKWIIEDNYKYPGPIQFFGDKKLTDSCPIIIK
ncbi:MAG: diphosphate--fructose-6-phosphate 1-phosphotransferase [Chlamydiae bacterium SM23_39]|nr:MAG: diphosphate--fructose-6-phosphate 1-phosphotransferase [Chlamydiae bacterium SM23_39]